MTAYLALHRRTIESNAVGLSGGCDHCRQFVPSGFPEMEFGQQRLKLASYRDRLCQETDLLLKASQIGSALMNGSGRRVRLEFSDHAINYHHGHVGAAIEMRLQLGQHRVVDTLDWDPPKVSQLT